MTDLTDLTTRVLEEVGIDGVSETPEDADVKKALQGLKTAHYTLKTEKLLRWTMSDIPSELEEPYILLGAFNISQSYGMPKDGVAYTLAMKQIRAHVMAPSANCPAPSEAF